jgi:hypothetical protein
VVFIAAFEGTRSWGDLYSMFVFGVLGWIMKQLGWPRPPMVLGLVIGGIFERYLFISTEIFGNAWLLRPVVLVIVALIAWALYRPLRDTARIVWREMSHIDVARLRFGPSALFTTVMIVIVVAALITSAHWPAAERLVPRTACWAALIFGVLNLVTEIFGADPARRAREPTDAQAKADTMMLVEIEPRVVIQRAISYFAWLAAFLVLVALAGFIPAIALIILAWMRFGFDRPWLASIAYAAVTTVLCWLVFDLGLTVPWPQAYLGDLWPSLRSATGLM